jgi:hypothetical protein
MQFLRARTRKVHYSAVFGGRKKQEKTEKALNAVPKDRDAECTEKRFEEDLRIEKSIGEQVPGLPERFPRSDFFG